MQKPRLHRLPGAVRALCLCAGLLGGCSGDQPGQLEHIQLFARVLRTKNPRLACAALLPGKQDEINCDAVLVPLLHYSPGFPGSTVTRRGRASGWRFSQKVVVPVHYEGVNGSGNVDVTMQKDAGQWRIVLLAPAP